MNNKTKNIFIIIICIALVCAVLVEKKLNKDNEKKVKLKNVFKIESTYNIEDNTNEKPYEIEDTEEAKTEEYNKIKILNTDILKEKIEKKDVQKQILDYIYKFVSENYSEESYITINIHDNIEIEGNTVKFTINVEDSKNNDYYYIKIDIEKSVYGSTKITN